MRFTTRELVYVGMFGAIWGALEVSLGSVLHAFSAPFAGAVLTAAGLSVALTGRLFVDRPGAVALIGLVTALLKMLSLGGLVLRPMLAIVIEAGLAEAALGLLGATRFAFGVAGAAGVCWTLVHPFITGWLFAGQRAVEVYVALVGNGARMIGVTATSGAVVAFALVAVHVGIGIAAGLVGWSVGRQVSLRLGTGDREAGPADR